MACKPPPMSRLFAVSAAADVVQVVQEIVPLVVMVPPPKGALAVMLVTVPVPGGVAQMPSPRQNVDEDASVPPFKCVTARLPVTPPATLDARLMTGMSADTSERNVGVAAAPLPGPAYTRFAACVGIVNARFGVLVGFVTAVVNSGDEVPDTLNEDTLPPPPPPPPVFVQVFGVGPQYLSCCAVMSQMMGSCVPEMAGVQFGRGSTDESTSVTLPC